MNILANKLLEKQRAECALLNDDVLVLILDVITRPLVTYPANPHARAALTCVQNVARAEIGPDNRK
jgi:hypothetical protein